MGPMAQADRHDAPGLIDEAVPGEAAMIDDVVVGFEDPVRQPVVAHELPDVFDRIEFGAPGRQRHQGDVGRHDQFGRSVPPGLIEQYHGVSAGRDVEGDLFEVHAHRLAVAPRHDDAGGFAFSGADRSEEPCRGPALIFRCRRPGTALCPAAGKLGLLTDARFVLPPYLNRRAGRQTSRYRCQLACEVFLKAGMASSF